MIHTRKAIGRAVVLQRTLASSEVMGFGDARSQRYILV